MFIFYIFAMILVSHNIFNHVVKRESGVNPEQYPLLYFPLCWRIWFIAFLPLVSTGKAQ